MQPIENGRYFVFECFWAHELSFQIINASALQNPVDESESWAVLFPICASALMCACVRERESPFLKKIVACFHLLSTSI